MLQRTYLKLYIVLGVAEIFLSVIVGRRGTTRHFGVEPVFFFLEGARCLLCICFSSGRRFRAGMDPTRYDCAVHRMHLNEFRRVEIPW